MNIETINTQSHSQKSGYEIGMSKILNNKILKMHRILNHIHRSLGMRSV